MQIFKIYVKSKPFILLLLIKKIYLYYSQIINEFRKFLFNLVSLEVFNFKIDTRIQFNVCISRLTLNNIIINIL